MSAVLTPDHLVWTTPSPVTTVKVDCGHVDVAWRDGKTHRFHPLWLRDNCVCGQCLHQGTREQLLDIRDVPLDIAARDARMDNDGAVSVSFSDGHKSRFHPGWLWAHAGEDWTLAPLEPVHWTVEPLAEPPTFDGPAAKTDDALLAEALAAFERYGIVRLRDLPREPGTVEAFALMIGPVRETQFERVFNVKSRADADSNAYTPGALSGHVDLPTWEATPGIQILHCLENSAAGGESVMIDGFAIAADLRDHEQEIFHNLSTVCWSHSSRKPDTGYRWRAPIIELGPGGELSAIRMTAFSRDPLQAATELIGPSYRALRRFLELMEDTRYRMVYPFSPGDLVMFDNRRILHGRQSYDPASGNRHLQGIYIDRDSARAKRRVIEQQRLRRAAGAGSQAG